jgi:hypothetical protein
LVFFASVTATHKCGDVGCATPGLDWALGIAVFGAVAAVAGLLKVQRDTPRAATKTLDAAGATCALSYAASVLLIFTNG